MKICTVIAFSALVVSAYAAPLSFSDDAPAINSAVVQEVNSNTKAGWVATDNGYFSTKSLSTVKRLLGVRGEEPEMEIVQHMNEIGLPDNFDSRTNWPGCIGPILDQAECGSCWAFGAAETASDRLCIESKAQGNANATFLQLAPLDLVACDSGFLKPNNGCEGGMPGSAMNYIRDTGLVTEKCLPYLKSEGGPVPTCEKEPCLDFVSTPKCHKTCADGSDFESDKHRFKKSYSVRGGADSLAQEIMTNGPVEGTITVFEDFLTYKSGVYRHVSGKALGGHAIKIIGFGTDEQGTPYWNIQNSWTTSWGDGGYIKILRGSDEIGIESGAVAGTF